MTRSEESLDNSGLVPSGGDNRFRDMVDRLPQTVFEFDLTGRLVFVNRTGLESFGYSKQDFEQGLNAQEMVVPEDREYLRANMERRFAGGPQEGHQYMARRKDGSTFPALVFTTVLMNQGTPYAMQGYLVDISERVRAEKELQESERKYKALVETTATGFVILDDQGAVLDANAVYVRMSGHRALGEIRGHSVVEWTAPHDQERNTKAVRFCLAQGFIRNLQIDYLHADGTVVPALINATVTEVEGKRQIITITRDMTERKRLEEELLRSEKLRSIGILAGGIAHDFNNILTAILGNISLLQATLRTESHVCEHLEEVEKASLRARELTRQLLTFSRGGEPVRKPFMPEPLIRESATLALRGRATACEFRIDSDLSPVDGDEGQVSQVLRNLVINASQAMNGNGFIIISASNRDIRQEEIHGLASGTYVAIMVTDHGIGISEEHRSRIFDPYFTTKPDGRGLGLAVCHSIVTSHRGAITAVSQIGHGSVFTVYLPVADRAIMDAAMNEPAILHGHGRILVMDDEESVRQIAGKIARALGYDVAFASDGREAIACWQQARETGRNFDLAIMDLTIPGGMGGREAIHELLAIDPDAKVVVSSGYSRDPVLANFRDYGFRDVLAKPYTVADMGRVLASIATPEGVVEDKP
jgi:two-component system cell cycle sensor histidine kinase/response regulator CckA